MSPTDDVFRWRCQAILEGLLEGATLEETKRALWDFVWEHAHGNPRWDLVRCDPELMKRGLDWIRENEWQHKSSTESK